MNERIFITAIKGVNIKEEDCIEITLEEKEAFDFIKKYKMQKLTNYLIIN